MNKYLNRAEKNYVVRMYTMCMCAEDLINYYQGKADRDFLKYLKTGITFLKKAMARRGEFMSEDAKKDWVEQCTRLEPFFVPSINSVREYQERMKLNDYIVLNQEDLLDFWTGLIPRTCGRCTGKNKDKCNLFKFNLKFNMPVMDENPEEDNCPYSYVATGMSPDHYKDEILPWEREENEAEKKPNKKAPENV